MWSCPATTGEKPPPCAGFSFTAIDDRRAVLFGGYNGKHGKMNDVYIIDLHSMVHVCVTIQHYTCTNFYCKCSNAYLWRVSPASTQRISLQKPYHLPEYETKTKTDKNHVQHTYMQHTAHAHKYKHTVSTHSACTIHTPIVCYSRGQR